MAELGDLLVLVSFYGLDWLDCLDIRRPDGDSDSFQ